MRDIQPLKFFGGIAAMLAVPGILAALFVTVWYMIPHSRTVEIGNLKRVETVHLTSPFTSLIPISGALVTLGFLMFALALLADMLGRHRRISEELLYLARRRIYSNRRARRAAGPVQEHPSDTMAPTLHDSWSLPVMKSIGDDASPAAESPRKPKPEPADALRP